MAPNKHPEQSAEAFTAETVKLWSILTSPFERDIDPLTYQTTFTLPVNPEAAFFSDQAEQDFYTIHSGRQMANNRPWNVSLAYVAGDGKLGVSEVDIPLLTPDASTWLRLRRFKAGFITLLATAERETFVDDMGGSLSTVAPEVVEQTLSKVGYFVGDLAENPKSVQLALAQLADKSKEFSYTESVTVPVDTSLQMIFSRRVQQRRDSVGGNKRRVARDLFATEMEVISEVVSLDGSQRNQLVVHFGGQDYEIDMPKLTTRKLILSADAPSTPGLRQYRVVDEQPLVADLATVRKLATDFTDSLMGDR